MIGQGGCMINVSTNCAELGVKNLAAYAASKARGQLAPGSVTRPN